MVEVKFQEPEWTWANNRIGEGYIEERLDRFFTSPDWHIRFPKALVLQI